jgi:3-methyl-2-oxobutanoate hydroxymethyltransferase
MARLLDTAGVDIILVGDSLSSPMQGKKTTLGVTMEQMCYHCKAVSSAVNRALVVGDMPFMSYQACIKDAVRNADRLVQEGGVSAIKLEGGLSMRETIRAIVQAEIPVMGHIGLTPQSFNRMGGYRIQGKGLAGEKQLRSRTAEQILEDALAVEEAGAFSVVLEGVPAELAAEITNRLNIPTIGIGAGGKCRGQILVTHDMLGLSLGEVPRFVKKFGSLSDIVQNLVSNYITEVQTGKFPDEEHSYK